MEYSHVIWDWNGTLINDVTWSIRCVNIMLNKRGLPTLDSVEAYHRVFGFPIIDYYSRIGFDYEKEPFEILAVEFVDLYLDTERGYALFPDVEEMLKDYKNRGIGQIILSACEMGLLLSQSKVFGIDSYFDEILGISDIYAASKMDLAMSYMERAHPKNAILIGDSDHDKEVADALGIDCILIARGHQSKETLLSCGAVVLDSIKELKHTLG